MGVPQATTITPRDMGPRVRIQATTLRRRTMLRYARFFVLFLLGAIVLAAFGGQSNAQTSSDYTLYLPIVRQADTTACTPAELFGRFGVRGVTTSADGQSAIVTFMSSATSFTVPFGPESSNWSVDYDSVRYESGAIVAMTAERRASFWAPQGCKPLASFNQMRDDAPMPGTPTPVVPTGINTDVLMERYEALASVTVLNSAEGEARMTFLASAQGQTISVSNGATITYSGQNFSTGQSFVLGQEMSGTYWAAPAEKPVSQGSQTRTDPTTPSPTPMPVTPSPTPQPSCSGVCSTNAFYELTWVRSLELIDGLQGQLKIKIMPNVASIVVPTNWTVTYEGQNFDGGEQIVLRGEEYLTAWAPESAKPLAPRTSPTKDLPAVLSTKELYDIGGFEYLTIVDTNNGQIQGKFLGATTDFSVPAGWTMIYNGGTFHGPANLVLQTERAFTLWAPEAAKPLQDRWPTGQQPQP